MHSSSRKSMTFHCRTSSNLTPRPSTSTASANSSLSESSDAILDMQLDNSNPPTPKPAYREIPDQEKPKTSVTKNANRSMSFKNVFFSWLKVKVNQLKKRQIM